MSVVLVSAVDPYPTDAGKKVVLAGFVDYFVQRYGAESVHYVKVGDPPQRAFPVPVHVVPAPSRAAVLRGIATRVAVGRASLQEAFLGSPQTAAAITQIISEIRPRLQVYDTVRMAQYAPSDVAAQQICYLDDLFSERYEGMLRAAKLYPDVNSSPLGNFADHVPRRLQPLADHRISRTALLRAERVLVRRSEDRAAKAFRRCLLVNQNETDLLIRRTGVAPGRIVCVPPLFAPRVEVERRYSGGAEFVFLGLLSLAHNDDGLRWFLRAVWPVMLERIPHAHLRVIGRHAGPELLAMAAELRGSVTVEGYVDDLDDAMARAAALINPLRFGSGIKLKVIEALARAVPVVSSSIGAEGISSGAGTGILVGADPAALADLLYSLTDPHRNAEASADARRHFQASYSRAAVFAAYDNAFDLP
ncbi:glycosyltransferase family 4 protein [Mycolicibacterium hodleri]|uniref:Glycosyltransferase n=1 Tax=Mycolicibacterium hodleri TaxID=49897 RepID=A0A502E9C9_9MYCO|nr:glycosyltransferase family 4 protein [Mycolicibacterium hodleri]TPG34233.1 glycosyltransferase [Mycolicibacterium hodleri]